MIVLFVISMFFVESFGGHLDLPTKERRSIKDRRRPTNILVILADDLGYGDTSVAPFTGSGVLTPELEKMAASGAIFTNFHTAAATCTPSRAAILTGMYPWRLGIKGVFEYGEKGDKGNRDDWLAQVPTAAMAFRMHNYTTIHSGKWHLGGMRNDDLDMRLLPGPDDPRTSRGKRRCPHPGPNQQGFDHYVSVLDGPGAPRQNYLQVEDRLYSDGCKHLLYNDANVASLNDSRAAISGFLSHCEATHAMWMMNRSVADGKPFYMHVWFHAPHGPWQEIPGYSHLYPDQRRFSNASSCGTRSRFGGPGARHCRASSSGIIDRGMTRFEMYRSMITDMDQQIGSLLRNLKALRIEEETLVVFLSDNGPEEAAGTTAGLRGRKRYIYEGGIRVPAIFQWKGTIPMGRKVSLFASATDLLPTFLEAAGIPPPRNAALDGMSLIPELTGLGKRRHKKVLTERVALWHNDFEGPRMTAAWTYDYKVILDEKEMPSEVFDMLRDPFETNNLLQYIPRKLWEPWVRSTVGSQFQNYGLDGSLSERSQQQLLRDFASQDVSMSLQLLGKRDAKQMLPKLSKEVLTSNRNATHVHYALVTALYKILYDFAKFGNEAHRIYLKNNPGRTYTPTPLSDNRPIRPNHVLKKLTNQAMQKMRAEFLSNGFCSSACSCAIPLLLYDAVPTLPFGEVQPDRKYLSPKSFINASALLHL